ncbi:MAG TPA: [protein-PII] uridylyltransferase, partial [Gammaproteobacteria bacterium]|nr:[protein-PII] uridylyltransferase [Gammaproteobacteria bacterium]
MGIYDEPAFETALKAGEKPIPVFKLALKNAQQGLFQLFDENTPIEQLVRGRAMFVDSMLSKAWQLKISDEKPDDIALLAVGGYGRGELHPFSDIDILILLKDNCGNKYDTAISEYITFLWDIGLEIGSSVRSLSECVKEAGNDITIATNIVESRLIYGPNSLYDALAKATGPNKIWPSPAFFEAKWNEQIKRHNRFHNTAYNLEPNIKESPGGLRDIQMIGWIAKRHFGELNLHNLVDYGFLTEAELADLLSIQNFLWKVRFVLHMINLRREDRLLFEHQRVIAAKLGFEDEVQQTRYKKPTDRASDGNRLAVELFMKQYYRNVMELSRLNEMLLQHYQETLLISDSADAVKTINKRFQINKGFLDVRTENIFKEYPFAILELFLLLQQNRQLKGVRASTIRLIRESLPLINNQYRNDLRNISLFMEIFKQPTGLTNALRRMNIYGVLAKYIPAFGKIVGQMQFDLFHIYTVDQHTLFVVRNLRRFFVDSYKHEYPLCSEIINNIPKPELLYIAGLF